MALKPYNNPMQSLRSFIYKFLRSSEHYTKTDMVYATKGGFWLGVSQVAVSAVSFGLSIAFANLLPPDTYGEYRYIFTLFNFLAIPTLAGINVALMRSAARELDGSLLVAFKTRLQWGLISTVVGLSIAGYYMFYGEIALALNMVIVSLFAPIVYASEVYSYYLRGKKLFRQFSLYYSLTLIIPALSVAGALFVSDTVAILLLCYFIPYMIMKVLFLHKALTYANHSPHTDPSMIPYGKHLSVMGTLGVFSQNIDKFLLWQFLGPTQLAVYAFALSPVSNLEALLGKLDVLIFPKIAARKIGDIRTAIYKKSIQLFFIVSSITALYIICAPFLYHIFFPQYSEAVRYSQILALTLTISLPLMFISTSFTAHAKVREKYYVSIIGPLVKVILFLILIPTFGIWGLIMSLFGFHLISGGIHLALFRNLS